MLDETLCGVWQAGAAEIGKWLILSNFEHGALLSAWGYEGKPDTHFCLYSR
ncbi:hypothetical protein HMPREF9069_01542 [Atopobium sp. oral taxon 810 str. F0209]|nr:hypothetical protein HMPREF9069_01542 [Atopobium sp. oral taxon 810 str. F0209]